MKYVPMICMLACLTGCSGQMEKQQLPMKPEFEYVTFIAAPAARVWAAITDPEVVKAYYLVPLTTLEVEPDEPASRVEYHVVAMGEMSQLTLIHNGFEPGSTTYEDIRGGWPVILSQLKTLLENGEKLPWPVP